MGAAVKIMWTGVLVALAAGCGDNVVSHCDDSGQACTWAGKPGVYGFNGDGNHRLDTELYWAMDMSFGADGTAWFIDWNNHLVRRVLADDTVQSMVGWTDPVFPGDGLPGASERSAEGALGTDVKLNHPTDLAQTADGKLLVMAWHNHKLRELDPITGRVRILAGAGAGFAGDNGPMGSALFKQPKALDLDGDGNMYILDQQNFRVRRIDAATGMITTIAGTGVQGSDGDGGPALAAKLDFDAGSNPEPSGGLAIANGSLYIAESLSNTIRAVDLTTGMISTVVAADAGLAGPRDMEIGPDGDLYIADTDNSTIRAVNLTTGVLRTIAGTGVLGLDPDDDHPALETTLARPFGITFDAAGNLYISDTINSRIVKVTK